MTFNAKQLETFKTEYTQFIASLGADFSKYHVVSIPGKKSSVFKTRRVTTLAEAEKILEKIGLALTEFKFFITVDCDNAPTPWTVYTSSAKDYLNGAAEIVCDDDDLTKLMKPGKKQAKKSVKKSASKAAFKFDYTIPELAKGGGDKMMRKQEYIDYSLELNGFRSVNEKGAELAAARADLAFTQSQYSAVVENLRNQLFKYMEENNFECDSPEIQAYKEELSAYADSVYNNEVPELKALKDKVEALRRVHDDELPKVVVKKSNKSVARPSVVEMINTENTVKQAPVKKQSSKITTSGVARCLIFAGFTNEQIFFVLQHEFGLSADKSTYPQWYRSEIQRKAIDSSKFVFGEYFTVSAELSEKFAEKFKATPEQFYKERLEKYGKTA